MSIPTSPYLQVLSSWPLVLDERFDPRQPSPWRENGISIPATVDPLMPVLSVLFNHDIAASAYASDSALSSYVFLTSLTDPGAVNVTSFRDVAFDPDRNLLTFKPATALVPGARYQATLRGALPDSVGRLLGPSYSWEFDIDPALYSGVPPPTPLGPPDGTVVAAAPPILYWGFPDAYSVPPDCRLVFTARVYTDRQRQNQVWSSEIAP